MSLFLQQGRFLVGSGVAGSALTLLQIIQGRSLTTNLILCLDAGDSASYDGSSQVWLDRSGGGYDFNRGSTSSGEASDPTFNGASGGTSAAEYFSFDGGDSFAYDTTVETWMSNLHKDNATFSWIAAIYLPTGSGALLTTLDSSNHNGILIEGSAGGKLRLAVSQSVGAETVLSLASTASTVGAWNFFGGSINEASGTGGILKVNATTETGKNPTYTSPSASAASPMLLGISKTGGTVLSSGSRLAFLAMWTSALTSTNLDDLYADIAAARAYGF